MIDEVTYKWSSDMQVTYKMKIGHYIECTAKCVFGTLHPHNYGVYVYIQLCIYVYIL